MPFYPTLPCAAQARRSVTAFLGYDHNISIADGAMYDMKNLTGEYFPLLSTRRPRGTVKTLAAPRALLAKARLTVLDGASLAYGDADLTPYLTAAGLAISQEADMLPKTLVSMGAYICIFPDKLYINTADPADCGSMEAAFSAPEGQVTAAVCRADGSAYDAATVSAQEPAGPANGALWIDTAAQVHVLKQYSAASGVWTDIAAVYTRLGCPGIGAGFRKYDGVTLSGLTAPAGTPAAVAAQVEALNGAKIIYDRGEDYIVVAGLIDQSLTLPTGAAVRRSVPDMDFVTEAENRLWGCRYGSAGGETVNAIYACALGDFKNWNQFLGLSTDSYAASVGTDGAFTGAVTHLGYPVFFKENCLHKVYISASGAHRIADTACRGVQAGSHNSLCAVNETLYYKSRGCVCAYDGSLPASVSAALGGERYTDAAAGALGERCYISMKDAAGGWHMFVLDAAKGFWHKEDAVHALCFARVDDELYYIDAATGALTAVTGSVGTAEPAPDWEAVTGLFGTDSPEHKYVGRINLRMKLPPGSSADLHIQYDSDGVWHFAGHIDGAGTGSFVLPVRPRRCDHFRFRLTGRGEMKLYSMAKILEGGSDI